MKTDICNQCTFHREGDNWGDVLLVSLFVRDKYTGLRSVCAVCSSWHQHWASMNAECEGRPCEDSKTHHQTIGHFIDPLCIFISSVTNHKHSYGNTFLENKKKKKSCISSVMEKGIKCCMKNSGLVSNCYTISLAGTFLST